MSGKRKGREQRRSVKRRQRKNESSEEFSYNGYNFHRLRDNVIEIKYNQMSYIGFVESIMIGMWEFNTKYGTIKLIDSTKKEFHFCFSNSSKYEYDAMIGKKDHYNSYKFNKKMYKAKIIRILPVVDAAIFKLEYDF